VAAAVEVVAAVERLSPAAAEAAVERPSSAVAEAAVETLPAEVAQEAVEMPKLEVAEAAEATLLAMTLLAMTRSAAGVVAPRTRAMRSMAATGAPRQSIRWPVARPPPVTRPPSPGCDRGVVRLRLRP
jgi:hypothetical protein